MWAPQSLRNNGPELTSRHFLAWHAERKIQLVRIEPGRPMRSGRVESFYVKFRDECSNVSWFRNLFEAHKKVEIWRREYNQARSHSSLGYQTPGAFAAGSPPPASASPPHAGGNPQDGGECFLEFHKSRITKCVERRGQVSSARGGFHQSI